ncbi:MAG: prepilin-type N-terminal cleavage/methylation domain-containing protein [Patescibacteria group bacterium]
MRKGLTLIEIVISVALITVVVGIGLIAGNPGGQLAKARNSQRQFHLQAVMNGIRQKMADTSGGAFTCSAGAIPTTSTKMAVSSYNIAPCLIPTYVPTMPFDPSATGAHFSSTTDYDSGYNILRNASTGQITVSAPSAELNQTISVTR